MYKDTRSGTVYIVENGLWESLVEDGKPGTQGRQGVAGSGTGVQEVQNIIQETLGNAKYLSNSIKYEISADSGVFDSLPNGARYVDVTTGEIIEKMKGQPLLVGGTLYERASPYGNTITATGYTTVDTGAVAGRGGLLPVIKANFLTNRHYGVHMSSSIGLNITNTATQYVTFEHRIGANVISRMTINLSGVPNVPVSVMGVISDLEVEILNAASFVADNNPIRSHAKIIVGYLRTGSGATAQDLAIPIVNEIYPGNIDCTIDNVITTRAYINIAGPTIYYNKIKIKI